MKFTRAMVFCISSLLFSLGSFAQDIIVKGKVVDENSVPIPGATILVKGTTSGTESDSDGNYSVKVDSDGVLIFSFIGYTTVQQSVKGRTQINVKFASENQELKEVVVTALGIKRSEKALGYAVQKVSGESLSTVKGVDVATSLTGKVAGLKVSNSTEFAQAPDIQLRGETPMIVIDGVPYQNMSLRDVPADDIESMTVLKGATASALYGSRGGSGAIMITTKKGGDKGLTVSINSSSMFAAGYLAIPEMQTTFGRTVDTATNTVNMAGWGSWGVPLDGRMVNQWDPASKSMQLSPYTAQGANNFKNFVSPGYVLNNNINIVQQGEFGSFRASFTNVNNKGQYPNSEFKKNTFGLGGEMKYKNFSMSGTMSYNRQSSPNIGFNGYTSYDPMYSMLVWGSPDWDVRAYKDYWVVEDEVQNAAYSGDLNNPYFDANERIHTLDRDVLSGMTSLTYDINSWLKVTDRIGFDTYSDTQVIRVSQGSYVSAGSATLIPGGGQVWGESTLGSYNKGISSGNSLNNDLMLLADKKINDDFRVDGLVGGGISYTQDQGIEAMTQGGLTVPGFYSLKASVNPLYANSAVFKKQTNSIYGRLGASWKNMLFAEGTLRSDRSSTLSKETGSYLYPSISGSFVVSELLPKTDWLSFWKIRASQTTTKKAADVYDINTVFNIDQNAWNNMSSQSLPNTIRGEGLFPESSATFEVGTLVNLFQNRVSIDGAYYSKRMYDFLSKAPVSEASGYSTNFINTGEEITRRGVELTINYTALKTQDLKLDFGLNFSKYARYYTKIDPNYSKDRPWIKEGERVDAFLIYDYFKDPSGNVIYDNGVPQIDWEHERKYGNYDPDVIWGLTTNLKYKNWSFAMTVDGKVGGLAESRTEAYMWNSGNHPDSVTPERMLDAQNPGTKNFIGKGVKVVSGSADFDSYGNITRDDRTYAPNDVANTYQSFAENYYIGSAWGGLPTSSVTYSNTYFKIRDLSVTYNVPGTFAKSVGMKDASISLIGQNLFLWAKDFKYSDPDAGVENFADPSQRFIGCNLKLDF